MRLINADRLLTDGMKSKYYHLPNGDTAIPIIDIEGAPTIDAVEVVRCQDCKWYDKGENEVDAWSICIRTYGIKDDVSESDYCSWGERREDGEVCTE